LAKFKNAFPSFTFHYIVAIKILKPNMNERYIYNTEKAWQYITTAETNGDTPHLVS
jgi:hypothetical protein